MENNSKLYVVYLDMSMLHVDSNNKVPVAVFMRKDMAEGYKNISGAIAAVEEIDDTTDFFKKLLKKA
jgi:hypothetical protein